MGNTQSLVRIYTIPACQFCHEAKKFLLQKGVEFAEYEVSTDLQALMGLMDIAKQRVVPVILVRDEVLIGYDPSRLEQMLNSLGDDAAGRLGSGGARAHPPHNKLPGKAPAEQTFSLF